MQVITLTTDFGDKDWFVGAMKGVVLGINPRAVVVDITHEISTGDIRAGAFSLMAACQYFPKGTIHVAVIDPGVGSQRRAIAAQTVDYLFVGPDNGVLSWAVLNQGIKAIRQLENPKYFLEVISNTFHGRDIFAPVAAHLSCGLQLKHFGRKLTDFNRLPWPEPARHRDGIHGEIVHIDRFGNAITNIRAEEINIGRNGVCEVIGKHKVRCALKAFYGAVPVKSPLAVIGSSGFLEISVNRASAAQRLGLKIGGAVIVHWD